VVPAERNVMILMVFRKQFTDGPRVARALLGYVRGIRPELLADLPGAKGKKLTPSEPEQIDPKDAKPASS
jgi:hypothetical protein